MSTQTTGTSTGNQRTTFTDLAKIFIGKNRYANFDAQFQALDYDDFVPAGTVMGQIGSTGKVVPLTPGASDGSQYPVGMLANDVDVDYGSTFTGTVLLCIAGDVAEAKVVFADATTLATVISTRTVRQRLASDTLGINVVPGTELTENDND